jgi:Ca-activated chloride channel homolog
MTGLNPVRHPQKLLLLLLAALVLAACGAPATPGTPVTPPPVGPPPPPGGGDFGASAGGVQDLGLARELLKNGQVPPAEALPVEGMFAEHDLPVAGEPCAKTLCLRAALAYAPNLEAKGRGFVQVGLSSTINPATFERAPLDLVLTIDVSGSMGVEYRSAQNQYQTPLVVAKALARRLVAQLDERDRVGLVTFGDRARTLRPLTLLGDKSLLLGQIDGLRPLGSTNIEDGLQVSFAAFGPKNPATLRQRRVMLFTDANPNVGATSPNSFLGIAKAGAQQSVGLTTFAFGVGIDQNVVAAMSGLRGGNAFSLFTSEDSDKLLEASWPWMVSPIAYNLKVRLLPTSSYQLSKGYGFPVGSEGLSVASVFLSNRRGALLVEMTPLPSAGASDGEKLKNLTVVGLLEYEDENASRVNQTLSLALPEGASLNDAGQVATQPSALKTIALAMFTSNAQEAARLYANNRTAAIALLTKAIERLQSDAVNQDDQALKETLPFGNDMLRLMKAGAPQGNLYGR